MQPFVPARLKRAFSAMRLKMPGGLDGAQNADLESSRKMVEGMFRNREMPPMREIRDVCVSAKEYGGRPDDEWQGLIRFFEPESCPVGDAGQAPLIVDVHGGGFTMGSVAAMQYTPMRLAAETGIRAASVEYRLAPEHRFPVGLQDVVRGIKYIFAHAEKIGVDPGRILLTGNSAGGNLIVAATLVLRDEGHRLPKALMPIIGSFAAETTDSARRFAEPQFGLCGKGLEQCSAMYLKEPSERYNPLVSPALADLRDMPVTCLFSAALDPLFDDSFEFAKAMREQGRECYLVEMLGTTHGGLPFGFEPAHYGLMVHTARTLLEADC